MNAIQFTKLNKIRAGIAQSV